MRTLFDTSVLVPALVDELPDHDAARQAMRHYTEGEHSGCCSTHTVAECYATITALSLRRRISPRQAHALIESTVVRRLSLVPLGPEDYRAVLGEIADRGLMSGAIYDALHAHCARKEGVDLLLTYNPCGLPTVRPRRHRHRRT